MALSPAERTAAFPGSDHQFTSSGVSEVAYVQALAEDCAQMDAGTPVETALADDHRYYPTCGDFRAVAEGVQKQWLAVLDKEWSVSPGAAPAEVDEACVSDTNDLNFDVMSWIGDTRTKATWAVESRLGYRSRNSIDVSAVESGPTVKHPGSSIDSSYNVGDACGWDGEHDAAIPFTLTTKNMTPNEKVTLQSALSLRVASGASDRVTEAYVEWVDTDGNGCSSEATPYKPADVSVKWNEEKDSGSSGTARYVVILKNYYSPRYPDGASHELKYYELVGRAPYSAADKMTLTSSHAADLEATD
jgi:hypothetical protein